MRTLWLLPLFLVILCVASCGGGGNSSNSGGGPTADMNGNWELMATSTVFSSQQSLIAGHIDHAGGSISGIIHILNLSGVQCFDPVVPVTVSGSLNGLSFTLTSRATAGQIVSVTGSVTQDGKSMTGTYSVTGGCASGDSGNVSAWKVPPFTGTWRGNYTIPGSASGTITLVLTQQDAQIEGVTTVTGTATVTGLNCYNSTATTIDSGVLGSFMYAGVQQTSGELFEVVGQSNTAGTQIDGYMFLNGGTCAPVNDLPILLTKQ